MSENEVGMPRLNNWHFEVDDAAIGWLAIDKAGSSTNVLSREVMAELDAALAVIEKTKLKGLVVYSGKAAGFVAGADINEFPSIRTSAEASALSREGQRILARVEDLPFPSVAVLNGPALGGGLELALAATWRLALPCDKPCFGLPEVQLGLHPGFGGTVRAVRLLGVRKGMELMLTGRPIPTDEASRSGLVDRVSSEGDWRNESVALLSSGRPRRRVRFEDRFLSTWPLRGIVARSLRQQAMRKADPRHYPAPFAMIELWRKHGKRQADRAGFEAESRSFGELAATDTSRNLVRVFFLQDRLKKLARRSQQPATRVHVIGAGIMGGDIAAWCVLQGLSVTLQDREVRYVEPALARAGKLFEKRLADPERRREAQARLMADVTGAGVAGADVVIEAIFENLEAKQNLLRSLESRLRPDCLLATNTSSIPLEDLSACLHDPTRLIGLHFFNPVAKLPLVEVVSTPLTSTAVAEAGLAFARQIGKLPLPCRSRPGFLVNRILAPYLAEAMLLANEGVPLPEIDQAAVDFGMPMGPLELADSVGLDIALHVARTLAPVLNRPVDPALERNVQEGHLGQKTGRGFYDYRDGHAVKPRSGPGSIRTEVQDRLILALLNESANCLAEQIVADADLVDAGVIFGTGFAPFRGGPLHYARSSGVGDIVSRLAVLSATHGPRFSPSAGWQRLGAE